MNTSEQVRILSAIATRDESGRHFTENYALDDLANLEAAGLITIDRPTHETTGVAYSQEYWAVAITDDGTALVECNPEYWGN